MVQPFTLLWFARASKKAEYIRCHCRVISANDEYTHHSIHVTQPYTGTTADNQLALRQSPTRGWHPGRNWPDSEHVHWGRTSSYD